jgi:hypothetical protein
VVVVVVVVVCVWVCVVVGVGVVDVVVVRVGETAPRAGEEPPTVIEPAMPCARWPSSGQYQS